jgi:hypothetical protein
MIETLVGDAIIHGIRATGSQTTGYSGITISGYATFILDRLEAQHMFDKYKLKNELGFDISGAAFNERSEITIDFTPAAATRAAALLIPDFPLAFSAITIANCAVATGFGAGAAAIFNGVYLYEGDARILQQSGVAVKLNGLKLTKYADSAQNAIMTAIVSG